MQNVDVSEVFHSIALYADGSFVQEVSLGTWAFRSPELNLEGAGSAAGTTVARFEFLGVLEGLEAVAAVDKSALPIRIYTDCDQTVADFNSVRKGEPLKKPERYADRVDLLSRLQGVLAVRQVQVNRYSGGSLPHQDCHTRARRLLRRVVDENPKTIHRVALKRVHTRLSQLIGERQSCLNRLATLDEEVSILQTELAALELSSRMIDGDRGAQVTTSQPASSRIETPIVDLSLPAADFAKDAVPVKGSGGETAFQVAAEIGRAANV